MERAPLKKNKKNQTYDDDRDDNDDDYDDNDYDRTLIQKECCKFDV